jgi:hypothetical protein
MDEKRLKNELQKSKEHFSNQWSGGDRVWQRVARGKSSSSIFSLKFIVPVVAGMALLVAFVMIDFKPSQKMMSDQEIYSFYVEMIEQDFDSGPRTAYDELEGEDGVEEVFDDYLEEDIDELI